MKTKPVETLVHRFARSDPSFQKRIGEIAQKGGKTVEFVYTLWRKYSDNATNSDQSSILSEFEQWYAKDLGLRE